MPLSSNTGDYRHGVLGRITPVGRAKGLSFWHSNNANGNGKMDLFCGLSRKTPDSVGNKLRGCAEWSMLRVDGKNVAVLIAVYLNNKLHHSEVQQLTSELTRQLQLLKDKLQDAYPGNIIFAGDFNSHGKFTGRPGLRSTTSQAFLREFIEEHNLVDVLQYAAKGYVDDGGFDPYWTAGPVTVRSTQMSLPWSRLTFSHFPALQFTFPNRRATEITSTASTFQSPCSRL